MAESTIRGKKQGFTVLYNSVLADARLSLKTKGLFAIMQSFPDDWNYSITGLASRAGVGRDAIRKCLKELRDAGYLLQEQTHDDGGKFGGVTFVLQEQAPPLTEKPSTVLPSTVLPSTENRPLVNKQDNNIPPIVPQGDVCKKRTRAPTKDAPDWKPERFEKFWTYYRTHGRGENKQGAIRAWDRLRPSDELIDTMARALEQQTRTERWSQGIGIPYASTWLNNARWTDSAPPAPRGRPQQAENEVFGWQ